MSIQSALEFSGLSDTGLVRAHNEDCIKICPEHGLAILADGMGGYQAGEVASKMCVDIISSYFDSVLPQKLKPAWLQKFSRQIPQLEKHLNEALSLANSRIFETAAENELYFGMGTTAIVSLTHEDKLLIAHVGDSRAYRLRNNSLTQLSNDHSVLQAQIDAGLISIEEAQYSTIKNLITRAVGVQEDVQVEIQEYPMQTGDVYLLCSDGLSDMLSHADIWQKLQQPQLNLACKDLIEAANLAGGRDNISVILFRVKKISNRNLMQSIFSKVS